MKNIKVAIIGGIIIVILFFIFLISSSSKTVPTTVQPTIPVTSSAQDSEIKTVNVPVYDVLRQDEQKTVTNYSILINPGVDGKAVAEDVKKKCTTKCNISIYDDKQAYFKYLEYDLMMGSLNTPQAKITTWKKDNYVFVADHLVGDVTFDTGEYNSYPFKDWYYKELKGEK